MIHGEDGRPPSGIIFDVLSTVLDRQGIRLETFAVPKKRELEFFSYGELDAHATAKEWVPNPDAFVFTDPILHIRNVIFSKSDSGFQYTKPEDLFGKRLVAHTGFVYPPLTDAFASGRIERMDSPSELSMLKMVHAGRGDAAIMNDAVGMWLISENGLRGDYTMSDVAVTDLGYRIMFAKKWEWLIEPFNRHLKAMRDSGELTDVFARYGYEVPPGL